MFKGYQLQRLWYLMAVKTLKVEIRVGSPDQTGQGMLDRIQTFLTATLSAPERWTVLDQGANFLVVKSPRSTAFVGDTPIAIIRQTGDLYLGIWSAEGWDVGTSTPINPDYGWTSEAFPSSCVILSFGVDFDLYLSVDETFLAFTCLVGGVASDATIVGVLTVERRTGDEDLGTFYGKWNAAASPSASYGPQWLQTPTIIGTHISLFPGSIYGLETSTRLGGQLGLEDVFNTTGNDIVFPLYAHLRILGKMKGKLAGVRVTTTSSLLTSGTVITAGGDNWLVVKTSTGLSPTWLLAYNLLSTVA